MEGTLGTTFYYLCRNVWHQRKSTILLLCQCSLSIWHIHLAEGNHLAATLCSFNFLPEIEFSPVWGYLPASQGTKLKRNLLLLIYFVIYGRYNRNNILIICAAMYDTKEKVQFCHCANVLCPFESDSIKLTALAEYSCHACGEKNCREGGSPFLKKSENIFMSCV